MLVHLGVPFITRIGHKLSNIKIYQVVNIFTRLRKATICLCWAIAPVCESPAYLKTHHYLKGVLDVNNFFNRPKYLTK